MSDLRTTMADDAGEPTRVGEVLGSYWEQRVALLIEEGKLDPAPGGPAIVEVGRQDAAQHLLPAVQALMENNLSRKGVWVGSPDRSVQEFRFVTEDVLGSLVIEYGLGQLSDFEMQLTAWILGQWQRATAEVSFSLRECARAFGVAWAGSRAEFIKDALRRIDRTRFTGRVWVARSKKFETIHFGIFDVVRIVERKDSFDGPSLEPGTVTITLSSFITSQLADEQFVRLDWQVLRGRLKTPLARRLYVFLESQRGFKSGSEYEVSVDRALMVTLGSHDFDRGYRFRSKLSQAGEEICAADSRYRKITVRPGSSKGSYVLSVRRRTVDEQGRS